MRFVFGLVLALVAAAQAPTVDGVAADLEAAGTEEARAAILAAHPEGRAEVLKIVLAHGTERFAKFEYDNALKAYRAALAIGVATQDDREIARDWRFIGSCLYRKNDLLNSLEFEEKALALSTKIGTRRRRPKR